MTVVYSVQKYKSNATTQIILTMVEGVVQRGGIRFLTQVSLHNIVIVQLYLFISFLTAGLFASLRASSRLLTIFSRVFTSH